MQDKNTGEMIEMSNEDMEALATANGIDPTKEYDPEAVAKHLESKGYCILRTGEPISVKSCPFKVHSFKKKIVMLETTESIPKFKIKVGEKYIVNGGNFVVESFGKTILRLRGLPGAKTINGAILDDAKVKEDRIKAKKQTKLTT